jgi:hypothetical protein
LKDLALAGVRKAAVLVIIDSAITLVSTSMNLPQQHEPWRKESALHRDVLPDAAVMIGAHLDSPLSQEAALAHPAALIDEHRVE